jgi:hypothetical protein
MSLHSGYIEHSGVKEDSRDRNIAEFWKYHERSLLPNEKVVTLGGRATEERSELAFLERDGFLKDRSQYFSVENNPRWQRENETIEGPTWFYGDIIDGVRCAFDNLAEEEYRTTSSGPAELGNAKHTHIPWVNLDLMGYAVTELPRLVEVIKEILAHQNPGQKCLVTFNVAEHTPHDGTNQDKAGASGPVIFGDESIKAFLKDGTLKGLGSNPYKNNNSQMHTYFFGVETATPKEAKSKYRRVDFSLRDCLERRGANAKRLISLFDEVLDGKAEEPLALLFDRHGDELCEMGFHTRKAIQGAIKGAGYRLEGSYSEVFVRRVRPCVHKSWLIQETSELKGDNAEDGVSGQV